MVNLPTNSMLTYLAHGNGWQEEHLHGNTGKGLHGVFLERKKHMHGSAGMSAAILCSALRLHREFQEFRGSSVSAIPF